MGIEEIKKAKEEAKRTFTRPSQKVAALLIALGPTTASEILKNIKDSIKKPLWRVLAGLSIPMVGETTGKLLKDKKNCVILGQIK